MIIIITKGGAGGGIILTLVAVVFFIGGAIIGWQQVFNNELDWVINGAIGYIAINALVALFAPKKHVEGITTVMSGLMCTLIFYLGFFSEPYYASYHWLEWTLIIIIGSIMLLGMASVPVAISTAINLPICAIRGIVISR